MRMIIEATMPPEPFNTYVKKGTAGERIQKVLDALKPEAVYFTARDGHRHCTAVVDVTGSSQLPSLAEPFFLEFDALVEVYIAMTPEDLAHSGLDSMGDNWG